MKCRTPKPFSSDTEIVAPPPHWQAELQRLQAIVAQAEVVPARFATTREWARRWGKSQCRAREMINAGLRAGTWETREFRAASGQRGVYPTPHYAEKLRKD